MAGGGVSDNGGAPDGARTGVWARTWAFVASRAGEASATPRDGDRPSLFWRVVLLGLSGLGTIAAAGCALSGHVGLALRVLAATVLLLGVLLAVATR